MPNTLRHKRSSTASAVPSAGSLVAGELAVNTADGRVYMLRDNGSVIDVGATRSHTHSTTDIVGLGTIATQGANAVAITGGSINGTPIGATTASTGAFTTIAASGEVTIQGSTALHLGNYLNFVSPHSFAEGRLTLTSGVPAPTTDQAAATTLFYTPHVGNRIALYSGSVWAMRTFTERSLSLAGLAANTNHDIFIFDNAGTPTLEALAWTNDSTRATALGTQDNVPVRSGSPTRRYVGTIRTTATIGQCADSLSQRLVWNLYNRVPRKMEAVTAASTTYTSATIRAYNAATTLGVTRTAFVCGLDSPLDISLLAQMNNGGTVGLAIDATNSYNLNLVVLNTLTNNIRCGAAMFAHVVAAGFHFLQITQSGSGTAGNFGLGLLSAGIEV